MNNDKKESPTIINAKARIFKPNQKIEARWPDDGESYESYYEAVVKEVLGVEQILTIQFLDDLTIRIVPASFIIILRYPRPLVGVGEWLSL